MRWLTDVPLNLHIGGTPSSIVPRTENELFSGSSEQKRPDKRRNSNSKTPALRGLAGQKAVSMEASQKMSVIDVCKRPDQVSQATPASDPPNTHLVCSSVFDFWPQHERSPPFAPSFPRRTRHVKKIGFSGSTRVQIQRQIRPSCRAKTLLGLRQRPRCDASLLAAENGSPVDDPSLVTAPSHG